MLRPVKAIEPLKPLEAEADIAAHGLRSIAGLHALASVEQAHDARVAAVAAAPLDAEADPLPGHFSAVGEERRETMICIDIHKEGRV